MDKEQKRAQEKERQEQLAEMREQHARLVEKLEAQGFTWEDYKEMVKEENPRRRKRH